MRDVLCDDVICDAHSDTHLFGSAQPTVINSHAIATHGQVPDLLLYYAFYFVPLVSFYIIVLMNNCGGSLCCSVGVNCGAGISSRLYAAV